jgi:hypothetical protein
VKWDLTCMARREQESGEIKMMTAEYMKKITDLTFIYEHGTIYCIRSFTTIEAATTWAEKLLARCPDASITRA